MVDHSACNISARYYDLFKFWLDNEMAGRCRHKLGRLSMDLLAGRGKSEEIPRAMIVDVHAIAVDLDERAASLPIRVDD